MREIKSITGLRVLSVDEGANVGTVGQVVVDLTDGAVLGVIVGSGAGERGVAAADIQTIGSDVIMISRRDVARPLSDLPELEKRRANSADLIPVFTNTGRRLGVVSGIFIDPYEKVVTSYEVSSGALKDLAEGLLVLPIIPGTIHGEDAVILPDDAVQQMGRETGGLFARFSQWGEGARKQYQQVAESAEKTADSGAETLKKEAAIARERVTDLSVKARQAVTRLGKKKDGAEVAAAPAEEAEATEACECCETCDAPEAAEVPETCECCQTCDAPETVEAPETCECCETCDAPEPSEAAVDQAPEEAETPAEGEAQES
jgi:uncharacterized protein YrrD